MGLRSDRGPVLLSVLLGTALVALDATIIATAIPTIVESIGGFGQFPWLFSIYLLAQAATTPVSGKLADQFGRKPVMLSGIGLFLLGTVLCGAAWSMPALIVFRAVQGLGAGAVQAMGMTIVGDIYTIRERGRVQGYLGSVWAMSAVVGPTIGGALAQWVGWRWVFLIKIPLCLLAGWILIRRFREQVPRTAHRVDYAGVTLLTGGCALVILGLLEGGRLWAWASPLGIGVPAAGVLLLVALAVVERRAAEPILPPWLFTNRLLVTTNMVAVLSGAVVMGLVSFVPTYVQGSLGTGPLVAGFTVAALSIGWPVASFVVGRLYLRIGFTNAARLGASIVVAGTALCALLTVHSAVWQVAACCLVVGFGLGWVAVPTLVGAQASVGWDRRGVVTGTVLFGRSIGSALGIAVFGAVVNAVLPAAAAPEPQTIALASHRVFVAIAVCAVATLAITALLPQRRHTHHLPGAG